MIKMISDYYFAMEIPYKESMKLSTANTKKMKQK